MISQTVKKIEEMPPRAKGRKPAFNNDDILGKLNNTPEDFTNYPNGSEYEIMYSLAFEIKELKEELKRIKKLL